MRGAENFQSPDSDNHRLYRKLFAPFEDVARRHFEDRGYAMPDFPTYLAHTQGFEPQGVYNDVYWFPLSDYAEKMVIPHKIAVWKAGMKLMQYLGDHEQLAMLERLFVHDASKFNWDEWRDYYDRFIGSLKGQPASDDFKRALIHHYNSNDHHPEHWLLHNSDGSVDAIEMPKLAALEMIADWMGASESYGTPMQDWLDKRFASIPLHTSTRALVGEFLKELGYTV